MPISGIIWVIIKVTLENISNK